MWEGRRRGKRRNGTIGHTAGGGYPPCFCVSRGKKALTGDFLGCRGNKGLTGILGAGERVERPEMAQERRPLSIADEA
jgi:hypothetical protein